MKFYVVSHEWTQGGNEGIRRAMLEDRVFIQTEPECGNQSGKPITEGWCGTTNDWATYAHGVFDTVEEAQEEARGIAESMFAQVEECGCDDDREVCVGENVVAVYREGREAMDAGDYLEDIRAEIIAGTHDEYSLRDDELADKIEEDADWDGVELLGLDEWISDAKEQE